MAWHLSCDLYRHAILLPYDNFTEMGQSDGEVYGQKRFSMWRLSVISNLFLNFHIWSPDCHRVTNLMLCTMSAILNFQGPIMGSLNSLLIVNRDYNSKLLSF